MKERESLGSRLGFILLSAGCAIGIGNVWRFPYITGQYGGGFFVLIYILFLLIMGIPIITMEYSVGRASRKSILPAFRKLEPKGSHWHLWGYVAMAGNYVILMFYSVISGWLLYYFICMVRGDFDGGDTAAIEAKFQAMMANPKILIGSMLAVMIITTLVCAFSLQGSVEKISKFMMIALLVIMVILGIRAVTKVTKHGARGIWDTVYAALNQSFFTLSIGMGGMEIYGSYIGKERSLTGEAVIVAALDTFVALVAGLIVFPACFAYGISPDSGPSLIFLTLPRVFSTMPNGRLWGSLFFLFLFFAAESTMIGVFENDVSFSIDLKGMTRGKAALISGIVITVCSIPCALGFNVWSGVHLLGAGKNIMDVEDFFVSTICLPVGSLIFTLFCAQKYGWGFDNLSWYFRYVLPALVGFLAVYGIVTYFM